MATLYFISSILSSISNDNNKVRKPCQALNDIFKTAKQFFNHQNYAEAYRMFYALGERYGYRQSTCAGYEIRCLSALGHWRQAIETCHRQSEREPQQVEWRLMANEIYIDRHDYALAWEELHRAPGIDDSTIETELALRKRIAYEGRYHARKWIIERTDILNVLPYDIATTIFTSLDFASLVKCTRVSKRWRHFLLANRLIWNDLDFSYLHPQGDMVSIMQDRYLHVNTVKTYLDRLGHCPLMRFTMQQQRTNGDDILMLLAQRGSCRKLKMMVLSDMICTPTLFLNTLEHIGSNLNSFEWKGVSIRLNDIIDNIPKFCPKLKSLKVHECFVSLYESYIQNNFLYQLERYGETFPFSFINSIQARPSFLHLESLELSGIYSFTSSHLASILFRCRNLKRLTLKKCLVSIIPVLNILRYSCPQLQYLYYDRNQYSSQQLDMVDGDGHEVIIAPQKTQESFFSNKVQYPWIDLSIQFTNMLMNDDILQDVLHESRASLQVLNLRGNKLITDQSFSLDTSSMCNLKCLCLRECFGITSKGLVSILSGSPLLEHIDVSCLSVIDDDVLQALGSCDYLQTLNLSHAYLRVSDAGFREFINKRTCTLKRLDLEFSNISKELLCFSMKKIKRGII
ncbi:MAG: hypothetical protein EXX96DRAFT_547082 [Benjaminiella poitrasii]|nr:MAG: hypothetical protein EXX96DRAFT_547082 [Benjaminiella poitrasii]